jgi:hypothetical protein
MKADAQAESSSDEEDWFVLSCQMWIAWLDNQTNSEVLFQILLPLRRLVCRSGQDATIGGFTATWGMVRRCHYNKLYGWYRWGLVKWFAYPRYSCACVRPIICSTLFFVLFLTYFCQICLWISLWNSC